MNRDLPSPLGNFHNKIFKQGNINIFLEMEGFIIKKLSFLLLALFLIAACNSTETIHSNGESDEDERVEQLAEPVTIKFMRYYGGFTDEDFEWYFQGKIKEALPHITVEKADGSLDDMIAANEVPDFFMSGLPGISSLREYNIMEDFNPYIKKYEINLSKYDQVALDAIRSFSDDGQMLALPFRMNIPALFYNKDVFDAFGLPYPQEGMTWTEAEALARELTRQDGTIQYLGIWTGGADRMGMQLKLPYVDSETNRGMLEADGWKKILNQYKEIFSVPGYIQNGQLTVNNHSQFINDRNIGMLAYWGADVIRDIERLVNEGVTFNWDMVELPKYEGEENYAWFAETHNFAVSSISRHKEEAFQIIFKIFSEPVQKDFNNKGQISVLEKTAENRKGFGSELPFLEGVNTEAFFTVEPGVVKHTEFDVEARKFLNEAAKDVLLNGKDINTALREANEKTNSYIQEILSSR